MTIEQAGRRCPSTPGSGHAEVVRAAAGYRTTRQAVVLAADVLVAGTWADGDGEWPGAAGVSRSSPVVRAPPIFLAIASTTS
jgi:hypothetical protein